MDGQIVSAWLFDPDGTMLEGPTGPVSHLICGGVYDWSTGLIYRGGRYFDPNLGIWLAPIPLMVVQGWRKRKDRRQWVLLLCVGLFAVGSLAGCGNPPAGQPPLTVCSTPPPTPGLGPGTGTPGGGSSGPGTGTPPGIGTPPGPGPLPSSYVRTKTYFAENPNPDSSAGVAIDTNVILTHNHFLFSGQSFADIARIEVFNASEMNVLRAEAGSFAMASDAEMGGGGNPSCLQGRFYDL